MPAGYSKRSLVEKFGIKEGRRIAIPGAPASYNLTLGRLPDKTTVTRRLAKPLEYIQFFCKQREKLEAKFPPLKEALAPRGVLWISWPKRSSKVPTDLNENVVREIALKHGLVDVKVCAVDEIWSALKLVVRIQDRK